MGLLDSLFSSPSDQALWALGSGLLGVRRGNEGAAMMNAMSTYNAAQQDQRKTKLADAQMQEILAQAKERQQRAAQLELATKKQQDGLDYLRTGGYQPGATVMKPETMQARQFDPLRLIELFGPEGAKSIMESKNWGMNKVARTIETTDPQGNKIVRQVDDYGRPVGQDTRGYVAPQLVDVGDRKFFATPAAGQSYGVGISPAERVTMRGQDITVRGQDLTDARARETNAATGAAKAFESTSSLRKEFEDRPDVKNYRQALPVFVAAKNAPNTPQGDINLIYAVGKVLDPTSVVREGEMTMVVNSGTAEDRIKGYINYLQGGGRLTPTAREKLLAAVGTRVTEYENQAMSSANEYRRIAKTRGLDPTEVVVNLQSVNSPVVPGAAPSPQLPPIGQAPFRTFNNANEAASFWLGGNR